jgi:hypothetical protein
MRVRSGTRPPSAEGPVIRKGTSVRESPSPQPELQPRVASSPASKSDGLTKPGKLPWLFTATSPRPPAAATHEKLEGKKPPLDPSSDLREAEERLRAEEIQRVEHLERRGEAAQREQLPAQVPDENLSPLRLSGRGLPVGHGNKLYRPNPSYSVARKSQFQPANLRPIMQVGVSTVFLGCAIVIVMSHAYDPQEKHWAYGTLGTILGFWLRSSRWPRPAGVELFG